MATFRSPADAIARGVAYVTEDRKARGLFPLLGLDENITVTHLASLATGGLLSPSRHRQSVARAIRDFDIRAARPTQPAGTLSGGNQQKALVARYLVEPPRVLILDEPTRGVDVGARAEIYRAMNRLTAAGLGILMISSDLPEVLGMSDRDRGHARGPNRGSIRSIGSDGRARHGDGGDRGMTIRHGLSRYAIFVALALECLIVGLTTDTFFTSANLSNVLRQNAFIAILAAGMTFVILTGGIDLSVGSVVGLSGVVCAGLLVGWLRRASCDCGRTRRRRGGRHRQRRRGDDAPRSRRLS